MAKVIVMSAIGGIGSFIGPVVAAIPIHFLNSYLTSWGEWSLVVFATIVIVIMRINPGGIAGLIADTQRKRGKG
jgi:branched-chain amino acid transport system permease protein